MNEEGKIVMKFCEKYDLGFIILQYGRFDLTKNCITSIDAHITFEMVDHIPVLASGKRK